MSNFPTGFYGLKARIDMLKETLGGDDAAAMAINDLVDRGIFNENHLRSKAKIRRSSAAKFLDMTDMSYDHIGEVISAACTPRPDVLGKVQYGDFAIIWDNEGVYRENHNGVIPLVRINARYGVEIMPAGMHLAMINDTIRGRGFRSQWRDFGSRETMLKKFAEWANKEFRCE